MVIVVLVAIIVPMLLEFLWHRWKCDTLGQIGEWVDESSPLTWLVVERASIAKLAFTFLNPDFALYRLVVGVHGSQRSFTEVLWKRIIGLSQIFCAMCELAVLSKWAHFVFQVVLAQLGFIFLFQSVELTLISVEVVVVRLLGQMAHDLSWWIIEISWPSLGIETFTLVARLFT